MLERMDDDVVGLHRIGNGGDGAVRRRDILRQVVDHPDVEIGPSRQTGDGLTNVPGPQLPLYVAGQRIEGMMGWAPLTADQVMSFTIYSYDGKVFVGIAADAGLVPDHGQIVAGFADAFQRLSHLTA